MMLATGEVELRCLFGFPNEEQMGELKGWLKENLARSVAIFEDELVLDLELPERMRFYWVGEGDSVFRQVASEHLFTSYSFDSLKEGGDRVGAELRAGWDEVHLKASDFQNRGLDILENLLGNAAFFKGSFFGRGLKGAFEGRPAVICGAGPSLEGSADALRALDGKALILAGGSALAALSHLGITPHMAGYIDPAPPFDRFAKSRAFEVPLLYQSRLMPQITRMHAGQKIWFEGSGNHPVEQWLLGSDIFDAGWNVATFLVAVASLMGCSKIALAGVDLDFVDGRDYAGGVDSSHEAPPLDWKFAAKWLKGYETVSLEALVDGPLWDVQGQVHCAALSLEKMKVDLTMIDELKSSFDRVGEGCAKLLMLLERAFPDDPSGSGEYALAQRELEEEAAYHCFLEPVWLVWKDVFARQMPRGLPAVFAIELNKWLFLKGVCDDAR